MSTRVCARMHVCELRHVCKAGHGRKYMCAYVCVGLRMCVCKYVPVYACMHVRLYI